MKMTTIALFTFISFVTYGQDGTKSNLTTDKKDRFTCQHVELSPDNKKIFLRENVKIETENLTLEADSAVFDNDSQLLVAYGIKQFTFNGGEAVISETPKNSVRYKLKDKTLYVD